MQLKKSVSLLLSFLIVLVSVSNVFALSVAPIETDADYVILAEPSSGEILYEKNADERANPASLTKIMTALILLEEGNLADTAVVSQSALSLDPGSSVAGLIVGEEITLEALLDCILIASANDACNVVAEHLYGSVDAFVARMNERAEELGCKNTHFVNTHGLTDENHYTTARDIYTITLAALQYPKFLEICNTASVQIPATNKSAERSFISTNNLITRLKSDQYLYPLAKGIKTGHTSAAGYCLVSSAEKGDLYLVSVVMHSSKNEETGLIMSFVDTAALFEWGFNNFSYQDMLTASEPVTELPVTMSSDTDYVVLSTSGSIKALLPNDFSPDQAERNIVLYYPDGVEAPVTKGQILGSMSVFYNGRDYGSVNLVAVNSVERDELLYKIEQIKAFFRQEWVMIAAIGVLSVIIIYTLIVIIAGSRHRRNRARSSYSGRRRR